MPCVRNRGVWGVRWKVKLTEKRLQTKLLISKSNNVNVKEILWWRVRVDAGDKINKVQKNTLLTVQNVMSLFYRYLLYLKLDLRSSCLRISYFSRFSENNNDTSSYLILCGSLHKKVHYAINYAKRWEVMMNVGWRTGKRDLFHSIIISEMIAEF